MALVYSNPDEIIALNLSSTDLEDVLLWPQWIYALSREPAECSPPTWSSWGRRGDSTEECRAEDTITDFSLAQVLAHAQQVSEQALMSKCNCRQSVKMSRLHTKWRDFLCTASRRWLAKRLCMSHIVRGRLKRSSSDPPGVCCLPFPGLAVIPMRTSALPHLCLSMLNVCMIVTSTVLSP